MALSPEDRVLREVAYVSSAWFLPTEVLKLRIKGLSALMETAVQP